MRAIVKLGTNTATGEAKAFASDDGCQLVFADGSNWAGTLVANEDIAFTNLTDGAAAATVALNDVRFTGRFPIRVWKKTGASDKVDISGSLSRTKRNAGFVLVCMDDDLAIGDSFEIGTCPAAALTDDFSRAFTANGFSLSATPADDGKVTLTVKRDPLGAMILVR